MHCCSCEQINYLSEADPLTISIFICYENTIIGQLVQSYIVFIIHAS